MIESARQQPTIGVLDRSASALELSLGEFFQKWKIAVRRS